MPDPVIGRRPHRARAAPLQKNIVDFLSCRQAPVLGAAFLDGYREFPARLAAETGRPTLVVNNAYDYQFDNLTYRFEIYSDAAMTQMVSQVPAVAEQTGTLFLNTDGSTYDTVMAVFRRNPTNAAALVNGDPAAPLPMSESALKTRISEALKDAMRAQDAHWSAMAGFRVGELYQKLATMAATLLRAGACGPA